MTDQRDPEPEIVNSTPAALRDTRWLAGGIWGAILLTLLVSSWAAVSGGAIGGAGLFFPYLGLGLDSNNGEADPELVASFALIITIALAGVLLFAWWRFATATRQLLAGISDVSDHPNADPAPAYWLGGSNAARSELVDLFPALGVAWALIVIRPVAVLALQIYSTF
jgi:hypothetical protein